MKNINRPVLDRAYQESTGYAWAWTELSGWRNCPNDLRNWQPSLPPPADAVKSQSIESKLRFGDYRDI